MKTKNLFILLMLILTGWNAKAQSVSAAGNSAAAKEVSPFQLFVPGNQAGQQPELMDDIDSLTRANVRAGNDANRRLLQQRGVISSTAVQRVLTTFIWPLRAAAGFNDPGFYHSGNFIDHNPAVPGMIQDYNCGTRSYDTQSGYNHQGTDIGIDPFDWVKMDSGQVDVIAAADGIIINKAEGYSDRGCAMSNLPANFVIVQHADGSTAWYWHIKKGSVTGKAIGQSVAQGEYLGKVGSSGSSTAPHLHFEVYDANNLLVDPWNGTCNTSRSWWANQDPYYYSKLQKIMTCHRIPDYYACPTSPRPNESRSFCIGDTVWCCSFFRDVQPGQYSIHRLITPTGSVLAQYQQNYNAWYSTPQWYFYWTIPSNSLPGIWKYQVTYLGVTYETSFTMNASSVPAVSISASNNNSVCQGGDITFSANPVNAGNSPTYQWYVNNVFAGTGPTYSSASLSAGNTVRCTFTSSSVCTFPKTATSNQITVQALLPGVPGAVSGPTSGVNGFTANYSIAAVPGANSYNWTVPTGASLISGQGTTSVAIAFTSNYSGGNISVSASNNCGTGGTRIQSVSGITAVQPQITSIYPVVGIRGNSMVINGTNFSTAAYANTVFFGGVRANVTAFSSTQLTVTVPTGAVQGPVSVQTASGTGYSSQHVIPSFSCGLALSNSTYATTVNSTTLASPRGTCFADLDGDGRPEMIVCSETSNLLNIYRNNSTPGNYTSTSLSLYSTLATAGNPKSIACGDFDGDGRLDIALACFGSNCISVFRNMFIGGGNFTFASRVDIPTAVSPYSVIANDFDKDGKTDLAVSTAGTASGLGQDLVQIFRNRNIQGNFYASLVDPAVTLVPAGSSFNLITGDIDGDGKTDLVAACDLAGKISIFRNLSGAGTLSFNAPVNFTISNKGGATLSDMNADGKLDLVTGDNINNTYSVYLNNASPGVISLASFTNLLTHPTVNRPTRLTTADVNGDGNPDVVAIGSGQMMIAAGPAATMTAGNYRSWPTSTGFKELFIIDVDGDSRPEVVYTDNQFSTLTVHLNKRNYYDNWVAKASLTGGGRSGAVGFAIGNKGYIGTGYKMFGQTRDFWEYDPATDAWTQKADFGGATRAYAAAFSIGTKGYVGTGHSSTNGGYLNDFWEFDPAANTWIQKTNFPGTGRLSAVGMAIGNKGYIGTGFDNTGITKSFYEYDPATNSWAQKADFGGTARGGAAGFAIGNKGYLGTGMDVAGYKVDFWEYDPASNIWTRKADFGSNARTDAFGFSIGSNGYIGCGSTQTGKSNDLWKYDPSANTWELKNNFGGTARSLSVAFAIGTKGYVGTGSDAYSSAFGPAEDFWEYDPMANMSISTISTPTSCSNTTTIFTDGSITCSITGGTAPYSASWISPNPANNFSTTYYNRVFNRNQVENGTHTVYVWSGDGCSAAASVHVMLSLPPTVSISSGATSICSGSSVTMTAYPSGNSYLWSNGATTQSITTGTAGTYTVTVTAPYGCTGQASKTVTVTPSVTPAVSITATPNIAITPGTTVNFTATPVNGGSAPTYLWLRNGTVVSSLGNTYSTSALANGDIIQCAMTSNATCVTQSQVASNTIQMTVLSTAPRFLVVDVTANRACYYDATFNLVSSASLSTNVLNGFTNAADVAATSTATYVLDGLNKCVYKSTSAGTADLMSRTLLTNAGATLTSPTGLTVSGDTLWVVDRSRMAIYRYSLTSAFNGTGTLIASSAISLSSGNAAGEAIWNDASYLYVLNHGTTKSIFRYLKSTGAWVKSRDLRTNTGVTLNTPTGMTVYNGTVWVIDRGLDRAYSYLLSGLFSGTTAYNATISYPISYLNTTGITVIGTNGLLRTGDDTDEPSVTIEEETEKMGLTAYPNPTSDRVTLSFNLDEAGTVRIYLLNMNGQVLYQKDIDLPFEGMQQTELNLQELDLATGVYLLHCEGKGLSENVRLVFNRY